MKKLADEEIQNRIEKGLDDSDIDTQAYKRVFNALKKDPEYNLPIQFADRLVSLLEKREEKRDFYWLAAGILFSIISLIVVVVLVAGHWSIDAFSFLSSHVGLVVFGVGFVAFLHWVDRKIVQKQLESHKH